MKRGSSRKSNTMRSNRQPESNHTVSQLTLPKAWSNENQFKNSMKKSNMAQYFIPLNKMTPEEMESLRLHVSNISVKPTKEELDSL